MLREARITWSRLEMRSFNKNQQNYTTGCMASQRSMPLPTGQLASGQTDTFHERKTYKCICPIPDFAGEITACSHRPPAGFNPFKVQRQL